MPKKSNDLLDEHVANQLIIDMRKCRVTQGMIGKSLSRQRDQTYISKVLLRDLGCDEVTKKEIISYVTKSKKYAKKFGIIEN